MKQLTNALNRAKFVFLNPHTCWDTIAAEPTTVKDLYLKYAIFLAAIPAICGLIGLSIIGISLPMVGTWHAPFFGTLIAQVVSYGVGLAALYVSALVIQNISPRFGGSSDLTSAFKLAMYSLTPIWLSGVFQLIPVLSILGIFLLAYGIYLFAQGPTKVLAIPEAKRLNFTVISILAMLVVQIVLGVIIMVVSPTPNIGMPNSPSSLGTVS